MMLSLARAHMESARGMDVDSQAYCQKDQNIQEWGTASAEIRTRWQQLAEVREIDPEVFESGNNS